jgi:hypothetical protein
MIRNLTGRMAIMLVAAAAFLSLGAGAVSAQAESPAAVKSSAQPDFTCPSRSFCIFSGDAYNGTAEALPTVDWQSPPWFTFGEAGFTPNPGSVNNNSGSAVYVFAADDGQWRCLPGVNGKKAVLDHAFGYFYITYGVGSCQDSAPGPQP